MTPKPYCETRATREPEGFRKSLAEWFCETGRDLPWRRTHDPYEVCVSEIMLQQTQVATVLAGGYFTRFLEAFPNAASLAAADDDSLLKAWEGLGYYRRARLLREAARAVIRDHAGAFPSGLDELLKLPGVGRYTAGAIRAFAFNHPAVLVDGNIARVLSRMENIRHPIDSTAGQSALWKTAEKLACDEQPRVHHAALMELGQRICRPGVPECIACPVAPWCATRSPEKLPVKQGKIRPSAVDEHALFVLDRRNRILLHRESANRRQGLWKLPLRPEEELRALPVLESEKYTITRYKVTLHVHAASRSGPLPKPEQDEAWIAMDDVASLAMPSPFRRVIGRLLGFADESV